MFVEIKLFCKNCCRKMEGEISTAGLITVTPCKCSQDEILMFETQIEEVTKELNELKNIGE